jgi:soluble lytic murein transglycosylase
VAKIGMGSFGQVVPRSGLSPTAPSFNPGDTSGGVAEAGMRLGNTIQQVAEPYIVKAEQEADASAVFAARRALDDWERKNVYDPKDGAIARRGADALDLPATLPKAFDEHAQEVAKGLTTQRQRMAFNEVATSRRSQIGAFADRHALQEKRTYDEGQYQADIGSFMNRAALMASTGDLAGADVETRMAQTRTTGYMRSLGKSEEEIGAKVREIASKASVTTVNLLLEQDLPMKADEFLKKNAGSMNVEDLLRAKSVVSRAVDARVGLTVASDVIKSAVMPAFAPSDTTRLVTLAGDLDFNRLNEAKRKIESGNRDFNKDGSVVTSKTGAKGKDQVLDSTNRDPGFGVVPARDNSLAERSRVGTDYMAAMLKEFKGDVPKALAAYNAGPGAVQTAIKDAEKDGSNWLAKLSPEAQAYVPKVLKAYESGDGAPAVPTLASLHQQVREKVGLDSPQRLKVALDDVSRQYKDMLDGKKQADDSNAERGYKWLAENGGRFSQMPAAIRAAIPVKEIDNLMNYGQRVAKGDDITNPVMFQKMATDDAWLKGMTDAEFFIKTRQLSEADAEKMAMRRGSLLNKPTGQKPTDMDTAGVNAVLNNRLSQIGIDPTPKDSTSDAQRVGTIRRHVWDQVLQAQAAAGKKFNDQEITKVVDGLFAKSVSFQTTFLGVNTGKTSQRLLAMKPGDIPTDVRSRLEKDFKAAGIEPTDGDLLGAYLQLKTAR